MIYPKGHVEIEVEALEATCTENGYTAGVKCSVCDKTLRGMHIQYAKTHRYGSWETIN